MKNLHKFSPGMESTKVDPKLCCVHQNSFFLSDTCQVCNHPYMFTLFIKYVKSHASGSGTYNQVPATHSIVERTLCMPFPSMDGLVFKNAQRDGKHYLLVSNNEKTFAWDSKQLHVMEAVIKELESVYAYKLEDVVANTNKSLQEGKR